MKFRLKQIGDIYIQEKFLWFPRLIGAHLFWLHKVCLFWEVICPGESSSNYWELRGICRSQKNVDYFLAHPLSLAQDKSGKFCIPIPNRKIFNNSKYIVYKKEDITQCH